MQVLLMRVMVFNDKYNENIGNTYNIYKIHYLKRKIKGINWKMMQNI